MAIIGNIPYFQTNPNIHWIQMNPMRLDALPDLSRWYCAVVPPLGHSTSSTLRCGPGDGSTQPANHRFFPRSIDQPYGCNHGKNPWIISIYSISSSSLFSWAIAFGKGGPKFVSSDLGDSLEIENINPSQPKQKSKWNSSTSHLPPNGFGKS